MRDTSFVVAPIPDHTFFEQSVIQRQVGDNLLQGRGFRSQLVHFRRSRLATSGEVAWRAVSPESRFFPASRNSLDQL